MKVTIPELTITVPNPTALRRVCKWGLLPLFALALMLTWQGGDSGGVVVAQDGGSEAGDGGAAGITPAQFLPDFSISSSEIPQECTTNFDDKKCLVDPGATFDVDVDLKSLGGFIDDKGGYRQATIRLDWSWNLELKKPPVPVPGSSCDTGTFGWDNLSIEAQNPHRSILITCFLPSGSSTYTGPMFSVSFNCPTFKTKETVSLVHGEQITNADGTHLTDNNNFTQRSEVEAVETLIVNCDNFFPWDITGPKSVPDGLIRIPDIVAVVQHFGESKPTP